MVECWAAQAIGNCCDRQSGEHIVSKSIFEGDKLIIRGFSWCKDAPKEVSVRKLKSNMLCERHNNATSDIDNEAATLSRYLRSIVQTPEHTSVPLYVPYMRYGPYALFGPHVPPISPCKLNGPRFERWLAKTVVNISYTYGRDDRWHLTRDDLKHPPDEIVRVIFGVESFGSPMGMYIVRNDEVRSNEGFSFMGFFHPEGGLMGASITLNGLRFIIWLTRTGPFTEEVKGDFFVRPNPSRLVILNSRPPIYRPSALTLHVDEHPFHVIDIQWR
jgi:hypothetical protein